MDYDPKVLFQEVLDDLEANKPLEERQFRLIYDYTCDLMRNKRSMEPYVQNVCQRVISAYDLHEDEIRAKSNSFDWAAVWAAFSMLEQYRRDLRQDARDVERIAVVRNYLDLFEAIDANPWCNQRALAEILGKSAGDISQKLEKIRRVDDLIHEISSGREKFYSLSETGARILSEQRHKAEAGVSLPLRLGGVRSPLSVRYHIDVGLHEAKITRYDKTGKAKPHIVMVHPALSSPVRSESAQGPKVQATTDAMKVGAGLDSTSMVRIQPVEDTPARDMREAAHFLKGQKR